MMFGEVCLFLEELIYKRNSIGTNIEIIFLEFLDFINNQQLVSYRRKLI